MTERASEYVSFDRVSKRASLTDNGYSLLSLNEQANKQKNTHIFWLNEQVSKQKNTCMSCLNERASKLKYKDNQS